MELIEMELLDRAKNILATFDRTETVEAILNQLNSSLDREGIKTLLNEHLAKIDGVTRTENGDFVFGSDEELDRLNREANSISDRLAHIRSVFALAATKGRCMDWAGWWVR